MKPLHVNSWIAYNLALDGAKIRVAVDAGANDGGYTNTLLEHGFEVHAFEPVPAMYRKMGARVGDNSKAFLNCMGLSDRREVIKDVVVLEAWTIGKVGDGGLQKTPNPEVQAPFDLHTITLDEYLGETRIGIFKLDVDGHEFKVLRGAEKTIRRDMPPILCEFSTYLHKLFGASEPEAFVNFIFGLGYKIVSCDGLHEFTRWEDIKPQWPWHTSFDVILLPR